MTKQYKVVDIEVKDRRKDGGRIVISTGGVDRDKDRVFPQGAKVENYLKNPVVLWGHNHMDAASLIGRANSIEVTETGIVADFTLRAAANQSDPQNIVLLLWEKEFVRASSIGFMPSTAVTNDFGGMDFVDWELLEFSLVSVPANQDALRLAAKQYPAAFKAYQEQIDGRAERGMPPLAAVEKSGRVLSASNEKKIKQARENAATAVNHLDEVLALLAEDDDGKGVAPRRTKAEAIESGSSLAWVRRLEAVSAFGPQQLYAIFRQYTVDIPADATVLRCDDDGNIVDRPHPEAGKTVTQKEVTFVPPLAFDSDKWGEDAVYSILSGDRPDEDMVVSRLQEWEVAHLSEVIDRIPATKSLKVRHLFTSGIQEFTQRGLNRAKAVIRRKAPPIALPEPDVGDENLSEEDAARLLDLLNDIQV